jgi:uridine kinase
MDDYYKNNADIPFEADGLQDFESVNALNIEILSEHINELLEE